ncbi:MAG: hypothetical protein NC120_02805 [Ruminococcus sp.]|nr:hypothetical protein [Ruminococcus sp.]
MIANYNEFCSELLKCGFSMGGGSSKGIFALIPYNWEEQEFLDVPAKWHTGDPETDPWEWRMRVLEERVDIAYSKLFFNGAGYITKEWYPYFISVRRRGKSFEEAYRDGELSHEAKIIYDTVSGNGAAALHEIKLLGGFGKDDKSRFDKAVVQLQMKMYITMCGRTVKRGSSGNPYGWNVTVFTTPENYFGEDLIAGGMSIPQNEAEEKIRSQILKLNPEADEKKIKKFIFG